MGPRLWGVCLVCEEGREGGKQGGREGGREGGRKREREERCLLQWWSPTCKLCVRLFAVFLLLLACVRVRWSEGGVVECVCVFGRLVCVCGVHVCGVCVWDVCLSLYVGCVCLSLCVGCVC